MQLRLARALLKTAVVPHKTRVPSKARLQVVIIELLEESRLDAAETLARRFNHRPPRDEMEWTRAKRAYLEAKRKGKPSKAAVAEAMAASGFKKSAIYKRAKCEKWLAQVNR